MKISKLPVFLVLWFLIFFIVGSIPDIQGAEKKTEQKKSLIISPKTVKPYQKQKKGLKRPKKKTKAVSGSKKSHDPKKRLPRLIMVPNLKGKTKGEATKILNKFRLKLGRVTYRSASKGKNGTIIKQNPGPKAKVKKGDHVHITLIIGNATKIDQKPILMTKGKDLTRITIKPGEKRPIIYDASIINPREGDTWYLYKTYTIRSTWTGWPEPLFTYDYDLLDRFGRKISDLCTKTQGDSQYDQCSWTIEEPEVVNNLNNFYKIGLTITDTTGQTSVQSSEFKISAQSDLVSDLTVKPVNMQYPTCKFPFKFEGVIANITEGRTESTSHAKLKVIRPGGMTIIDDIIDTRKIIKGAPFRFKEYYRLPTWGIYKAILTADARDELDELNEINNSDTTYFSVDPMTDLQVYIRKIPDVRVTVKRTISAEVKNVGQKRSPATKLYFWVEGHGSSNYSVPPLEPGEKYVKTRRHRWYTSGTKTYHAKIDPNNSIRELDETNNEIQDTLKVHASAFYNKGGILIYDLAVTADVPSMGKKNQSIPFLVTVKNVLERSKAPPSILQLSMDDHGNQTINIPELFYNETFEIPLRKKWTSTGPKRYEFVVDCNCGEIAHPADNNKVVGNINITP